MVSFLRPIEGVALTPDEAIRRVLSVPPPAKEEAKPKGKVKAVTKQAGKRNM